MSHSLLNEAKAMQEQLSAWRRALHKIPETGTQLPQTVQFIEEQLKEMNVDYQVYEDCSCIVAQIGTGGKCFLLRSDMDALPIKEESGEPFASENGCMHACGHDLHAATLLGAAKLLKAHEGELCGTVKLLFQSGEEVFAGAKKAIERGVLENPKVDAAFAMHVASVLPANVIIYGPYPMSSVYGFRITLTGKGAHGSTPEQGIDPINTGVHLYLGLQELIAREVGATEEASLTIGRFSAGAVSNVIPERAVLEGTLRTFKPELRERLIQRIHQLTETISAAYRTRAEIEVLSDVPACACDEELNREITASIHELDDSIVLLPKYHVMGSEDFAFFTEQVPSSYFGIGAAVEDRSKWVGQHNPKVVFTESCLPVAVASYVKAAMDWLQAHRG